MKISKLLIIFSILFLSTAISVLAQLSIEIADTTLQRGEDNKILLPVKINLPPGDINSVTIKFKYDARIIDISSVSGGTDYIMLSQAPDIKKSFSVLEEADITVSDNTIAPDNGNILCVFEIEGLAAEDSIAYIEPVELYIDNELKEEAELARATIKVTGDAIIRILPEGLGDNYPNPFYQNTRVIFNIKKETNVTFSLFSVIGEKVADSESSTEEIKFEFFTKDGTPLDVESNPRLQPGKYELLLTPLNWKFASGPYYLLLETGSGAYNKSILYHK